MHSSQSICSPAIPDAGTHAVAEAFAKAARESARRDAFMATVAHELRNIISPLSCSLKLMELGRNDPKLVDQALPVAQRQVQHMSYLVSELLDIGRVINGQLRLARREVDLRGVVAEAVQSCAPFLDKHELVLDTGEEALRVDADPVRLTQVVTNLLHNAAKFTPPGGRIRVACRAEDGCAAITVTDDGVGIARDDLERIFDMFEQEERNRDHSADGLGIGLALVRRLAELHGGEVRAQSDGPGRGATFTVRLPALRML